MVVVFDQVIDKETDNRYYETYYSKDILMRPARARLLVVYQFVAFRNVIKFTTKNLKLINDTFNFKLVFK